MSSSSSESSPSPRLRSGRGGGRFAAWSLSLAGGASGEGTGETTTSPSSSGEAAGTVVHSSSTTVDEGGDLSGGEFFLFVDDALVVWGGPGGELPRPRRSWQVCQVSWGDSSSVGGGGWSQGRIRREFGRGGGDVSWVGEGWT